MAQHKRLARKDLRQPDAFQSTAERMAGRIMPHAKKIIGFLAALLLIGAVVWAIQFKKDNKNAALNNKLSGAMAAYEEQFQLGLIGEAQGWESVKQQFETLLDETIGTPLYPIVLQYLANTYIEMGQLDAALGPIGDLQANSIDNPELQVMAFYLKAKALELKGDRKGANEAYNEAGNIVPNSLGEFLEEEAKRNNGPGVSPELVEKYTKTDETDGEEGGQ